MLRIVNNIVGTAICFFLLATHFVVYFLNLYIVIKTILNRAIVKKSKILRKLSVKYTCFLIFIKYLRWNIDFSHNWVYTTCIVKFQQKFSKVHFVLIFEYEICNHQFLVHFHFLET